MFCNFNLRKIFKTTNNSIITEAREQISTYLESSEFQKILMYVLQNLKAIKFYFFNYPQTSSNNQAIYNVKHPH